MDCLTLMSLSVSVSVSFSLLSCLSKTNKYILSKDLKKKKDYKIEMASHQEPVLKYSEDTEQDFKR